MTDEAPKSVNYSSNSKAVKPSGEVERPPIAQVVESGTTKERKKSVGRRFREQFAGDDAKTVGQVLLFDVVVPATKNLLFDLVREGAQRLLFGGSRPAQSSVIGTVLGSRTSYISFSKPQAVQTPTAASAGMTPEQRAMHDFSGVIFPTREQATLVIDTLSDYIENFGTVSVNDFYAAIGESPTFTSVKYGWTSLAQAQVRHIGRDGYLLEMPKPKLLE